MWQLSRGVCSRRGIEAAEWLATLTTKCAGPEAARLTDARLVSRVRPACPVTKPAMRRASRTAYGSLVVDWVSIRAASPWRRRWHRSAEPQDRSAEPQDHAQRVPARRRQRRAALDRGATQRVAFS
eukprot:scaffold50951_cov84-Phaeocystis_antarctica.AAC.2